MVGRRTHAEEVHRTLAVVRRNPAEVVVRHSLVEVGTGPEEDRVARHILLVVADMESGLVEDLEVRRSRLAAVDRESGLVEDLEELHILAEGAADLGSIAVVVVAGPSPAVGAEDPGCNNSDSSVPDCTVVAEVVGRKVAEVDTASLL